MPPVIRIDDEVMHELKKRAIDLGLVFEPPNVVLRRVLGLDSQTSLQPQAAGAPIRGKETTAKMTTLVIHAPWNNPHGKPGQPLSWETYVQTGVGKGYAISQEEVSGLTQGSKVVLLRNDRHKRRAEGTLLSKPIRTDDKTSQGIWRYDVHFKDIVEVDYSYRRPEEKLTRRGVKVIDC